jgi:uncharacterized protein YjbJ (UPF0337 family)
MHGGRELVFEGTLEKDRVKGGINEVAGGAKRKLGEWTGDQEARSERLAQEVKGQAQKAWSGLKDAVLNAKNEASGRAGKRTAATRLNRA